MGDHNLIFLLLLQVALIVALSRAAGALFAKMRQPQVIGEMVAGIMLGPSLFGYFWPALHRSMARAGREASARHPDEHPRPDSTP